MNTSNRLFFADFTKLFAMFVVTWGHCAQCLSGETYPWMFGCQGLSIAFHMPLFMMISGYFLNPDKIKQVNWKSYIKSKFNRLMIPVLIWYPLYCILTIHKPYLWGFVNFYWFLSSMFLSYIIILIVCKITGSRHISLILLSVVIVICLPFSSFLKVNFMYPLIWGGYFYQLMVTRNAKLDKLILPVSAIISIVLLYFWNIDYSVYRAPFDVMDMNISTIKALFIRLITGFIVSIFFISLFKKIENYTVIQKLAKYGKYTLVMYTASFVLNGMMRKILTYIGASVTQPCWIESLSLIWAIVVCLLCVLSAMLMERNRILSKFLLGC